MIERVVSAFEERWGHPPLSYTYRNLLYIDYIMVYHKLKTVILFLL